MSFLLFVLQNDARLAPRGVTSPSSQLRIKVVDDEGEVVEKRSLCLRQSKNNNLKGPRRTKGGKSTARAQKYCTMLLYWIYSNKVKGIMYVSRAEEQRGFGCNPGGARTVAQTRGSRHGGSWRRTQIGLTG